VATILQDKQCGNDGRNQRWMASCKPRVSPSVKQPRSSRFPAARCRRGARIRKASMHVLRSWPFFTAFLVSPSCIAWSLLYMGCLSRLAPAGFAWFVSCWS